MSKSTQALNLSHWFTIDKILFGKTNPKDVLSESDYKGYVTAKGAALSNLFDMFKKMGVKSTAKFGTLQEMQSFSDKVAKASKVRAKKIITTEAVAKQIRDEIKKATISEGVSTEDVAKVIVDHEIKTIALDLVMFESALASTNNKKSLSDWRGKIMVDAYRTLRDALVKYAY